MKQKKSPILYRFLKWCLGVCYGKVQVFGSEHLPQEPCIIVGNHSQLNGPICCELFFPIPRYTWCAGEMMSMKELPAYAFHDFWSFKPKHTHWFFKIASYVIAPIGSYVCKHANTIGVFRDSRVLSTFKKTLRVLEDGTSVVVFPEYNKLHNQIIYDFQDKFIDLARMYYKRTGKCISFVPLYIAPALRQMHLGEPVTFSPDVPMDDERRRIRDELMTSITEMAQRLPRHTVVPYRNIPRKNYPTNLPHEVDHHEKTCC